MVTLVIGGAASGKSEYAEARALSLPGKRVYLATMRPSDGECLARIEKHRLRRAVQVYILFHRLKVPAHPPEAVLFDPGQALPIGGTHGGQIDPPPGEGQGVALSVLALSAGRAADD